MNNSFFESWAFIFPLVGLIVTCAVFVALICFEKWRQRTRKSAIKAEVQAIEEQFQAIIRGVAENRSDK